MKFQYILFSLVIGLILIGNASAQTKNIGLSPSLFSAMQKQTEKWKEAYNSGDAKNLVAFYTENATYVSGHVAGLELNGRDKLIANFQNGISGGGHIDSIEIVSAHRSCEMVTLMTKYQATNNGQTVTGRNLLVLKKINNEWLIILHASIV